MVSRNQRSIVIRVWDLVSRITSFPKFENEIR
jgi:hypothetical protein